MAPTPIEELVQRFRGRARAVLLVRTGLVTLPASIFTTLLVRDLTPTAAVVTAAIIVFAVLTTVLVTVRHTPGLVQTAATIDRRLQLPNHVSAALQLARDEDAMATLIVHTALRRMDGVRLADVFPMRATRHAWAAFVFLAMSLIASLPEQRVSSPRLGSDQPAVPGAERTAGVQTGPADPTAGIAQGSDVPRNDSLARVTDAEIHRTPSAAPGSHAQGAQEQTDDLRSDALGIFEVTNAPQRLAAATQTSSEITASFSGSHASAAANRDGAAAGNSGGDAVGGGGNRSAARGAGGKAGGVSQGVPDQAALPSPSDPGTSPKLRWPGRRAAQLRPQAALTNDDIPPSLRRYVRDYFIRLQAMEKR
jgi:hypothetical protein